MFISVYAIAKNEELIVSRWYECFKEADEVCVLVNNSTDNTAKALRKLGAKVKVKNYPSFRFDVARNDSMKICSKKADLLFCTDIDDTVEKGWRKKIEYAWNLGLKTGKNPNSILFSYSVSYGNGAPKQTFLRHSIHTPNGWYWKCRIHEYLEATKFKEYIYYPKFEVVSRPIKQDHSQYLTLLEEECRYPNCEARNKHLLAREYLQLKRYDEAVEWFHRHLNSPDALWKSERAASMKFLSDCYGGLGFENAKELWLWKAMNENPKDRDAPFVLGMLLMKKKEYRTAEEILERCVKIEKPELDYPYYVLESWTERPWLCLAETRYYNSNWDGANKALDTALKINPKSELGLKMKKELNDIIASGRRPPIYVEEIPRERIEIPELV